MWKRKEGGSWGQCEEDKKGRVKEEWGLVLMSPPSPLPRPPPSPPPPPCVWRRIEFCWRDD
ncbi:hypothetical protein E2C01_028700 [Portunus trituberculatus]|uniref:Uncharacterized protein n=1 Tax=Portunus trituberculatus TaxID=210409 RepID=A0A5B7EL54_PORTR|nr:hypothetical protein [Portunus trituberculatus]